MTEHHEGQVQLSGAGNEAPSEAPAPEEQTFKVDETFVAGLQTCIEEFCGQLDDLRDKSGLPRYVMSALLTNFVLPVGQFYGEWCSLQEEAEAHEEEVQGND